MHHVVNNKSLQNKMTMLSNRVTIYHFKICIIHKLRSYKT